MDQVRTYATPQRATRHQENLVGIKQPELQANIDEEEKNDLKNNFRRKFEALEKKMRNSPKEIEEMINKKLEDINKSLKENQEKAIKHMKEITQDLKTEIDTIKKTQAEEIIETEIMRKHSGSTNASINSKYKRWKRDSKD